MTPLERAEAIVPHVALSVSDSAPLEYIQRSLAIEAERRNIQVKHIAAAIEAAVLEEREACRRLINSSKIEKATQCSEQ